MYGLITTLRQDGHPVKHILWTAFKMSDHNWRRVIDARDILGVRIPCHLFRWKLIDSLGFESHSAILLGRKATHPLACSSSS